jgi:hypothetical protein
MGQYCLARKNGLRKYCLPADPPGEVDQELVENALEEIEIRRPVDAKHRERRSRLNRRIHVVAIPFACRQLPVRVHVLLAGEEQQLALSHRRVSVGENHTVKGEVPRSVRWVLPLIGDVVIVEVPPSELLLDLRVSGGGALSPLSQRATS